MDFSPNAGLSEMEVILTGKKKFKIMKSFNRLTEKFSEEIPHKLCL